MRITRISDHAFQLTQFGFINCYLVRESDGFTLIDTGIRKSAMPILDAARHYDGQIRRIVLTHAHVDHIAGLDHLSNLLGKVDVGISRRDARLLASPPDFSLDPGELQPKTRIGFPGSKTMPTHFVEDCELFGSLRAITTPGHTPGHMSFLDERDGSLYAGDAFVAVGGLRVVCDAPWYFPDIATWHKPTALNSANKLSAFSIQRFACGHGKIIEGGQAALERALFHATAPPR